MLAVPRRGRLRSARVPLEESANRRKGPTCHDRPRSGLSRRGLLGAVAGVTAATAVPAVPRLGRGRSAPGSRPAPSLDKYDRQIVSGLSSRACPAAPPGAVRDDRPADRRYRERDSAPPTTWPDQLDRFGYQTRLEPFPVADKFLAQIGDPRNMLPNDLCWQAGAAPGGKPTASPCKVRLVDVGPPPRRSGRRTSPVRWCSPTTPAAARPAFVAEAAARGAVAGRSCFRPTPCSRAGRRRSRRAA